ncbi:MAG: MerR family DNA-binding transcriptional regulator, partial [Dehalococcoidia bacterium]|nr:MerR family DNA-binding transcriptional regulator [Dehalococcoidia bacterium]
MAMEMFMIGELASVVGLNPATIRYYEEIGLIPQPVRSESGYRLYSEGEARRLRFIQQAKMLSLSLDEIRDMVHSAIDGRCGILQEELLTLLRKKLEDTRRRISELEQFEKELRRFCDDLTSRVSSY